MQGGYSYIDMYLLCGMVGYLTVHVLVQSLLKNYCDLTSRIRYVE